MSPSGKERQSMGKLIVSNATAMSIFGILNTSFVVSYASLIFASTCPEYFTTAVALFLVGGCVVSIILASLSTYPGVISMIQDVPVAISGLMAVALAGILTNANPDALFANIFASIAISTLLTGISFMLLGYFKLGNLVRFIPYPVMGGFLAATGWLLLKGGLQVTTGVGFNLLDPAAFFQNINPMQLACGLVFGIGLLLFNRKFPSKMLVMPGTIVGAIIVFLITTKLLGISIAELQQGGWLLGPLPDKPLWQSATFPQFHLIDWPVVLSQGGSIATIVVLSVISFLLNSTGIEFIAGRDLDMNRDLKATGIANLATGFISAPASYVFISQTALATRIGAKERTVGILHGCFLLMVFFVGGAFLSFFPKFVAGGLPIYLGLSMLWEWIVDVRKSVPKVDYAIILVILVSVELLGFLQGIGLGIVASVIIFVFRYSSINIVKSTLDGTNARSSKDRPITDQRLLDYNSHKMLILQLQGFIFFGTANSLYEKVKNLSDTPDKASEFILLDMQLVQGIDSSAIKSFQKLAQHAEKRHFDLILVNISPKIRQPFEADGFTSEDYECLSEFNDLDHATEWCEDRIIKSAGEALKSAQQQAQRDDDQDLMAAVYSDMMAALDTQVLFETVLDKMTSYLHKLEVSPGDLLFRQKESSRDLYFISRGQVTLSRTNREGQDVRIRTLGPWTITGELGAFLGYRAPYTAEVVKDGMVYKLSADALKRMDAESTELTSELHRLIIKMLGNQLLKTSKVVSNFGN